MSTSISIVTPSFQQARWLPQTLESVTTQLRPGDEYFVIDGGSDDGSVDVIKAYESRLTGWVSEPDQGQADAVNKGYRHCTGEVLGWVNSDDLLLPGALDRVREAFAKDPDLEFLSGWAVFIDADGRITRCRRRALSHTCWAKAGLLPLAQPACFYRRTLLETAGPLDPSLWLTLDQDLFYRMLRSARKICAVHRYLAACTVHPDAKTQQLGHPRRSLEFALMDRRHPDMRPQTPTAQLLRFIWRIGYYAAVRRPEKADTRRYAGRHWQEVFGMPTRSA
jgi:glycosyltransferase involved in cell wall biosynthesis